jgi:hypothetical protein
LCFDKDIASDMNIPKSCWFSSCLHMTKTRNNKLLLVKLDLTSPIDFYRENNRIYLVIWLKFLSNTTVGMSLMMSNFSLQPTKINKYVSHRLTWMREKKKQCEIEQYCMFIHLWRRCITSTVFFPLFPTKNQRYPRHHDAQNRKEINAKT